MSILKIVNAPRVSMPHRMQHEQCKAILVIINMSMYMIRTQDLVFQAWFKSCSARFTVHCEAILLKSYSRGT